MVTHNEEDAKDAAQTAIIKAIKGLDGFRQGSPFRPWLVRIVTNEAKDHKSASIRRATFTADLKLIEQRPSTDATPEAEVEQAEQRQVLLAAVRKLRPEDQMIVAYRYFFDLSEAEMAEVLDCPRGTVKSRLSRSLIRLREVMSSDQHLESGERSNG